MAAPIESRAVPRDAGRWYGTGIQLGDVQLVRARSVRLPLLWHAALRRLGEVRIRYRLALVYATGERECHRLSPGRAVRNGSRRDDMRHLRRAPGARFPGWTTTKRIEVLHERGGSEEAGEIDTLGFIHRAVCYSGVILQ